MPNWTKFFNPSESMIRSMQPESMPQQLTIREFYTFLDIYYQNVDLYTNLKALRVMGLLSEEQIMGLRNPCHRVVEFYAKKMWPGKLPEALPIITSNKRIVEPIQHGWKVSNLTQVKQVLAREAALYGDCFGRISLKLDTTTGRATDAYIQRVDPKLVTTFQTDYRQFITMIRLDREIMDPLLINTAATAFITETELWTKEGVTIWQHRLGINARLDLVQQQPPLEGYPKPLSTFGIDFVPFVHGKFLDIGDLRGVSSFQHALDKIDDVNRAATNLHYQIFKNNRNTWSLESAGVDRMGRPLPALTLSGEAEEDGIVKVEIAGDEMWTLPGTYALKTLVPPLPYGEALAILESAMEELLDDLPELAYNRARHLGSHLTGVAMRLTMAPAVDSVIEARGNMESFLAQLDQMLLTVAQVNNLPGYEASAIGTFADGDFDHAFAERAVIPLSEDERGAEAQAKLAVGVPQEQIWLEYGYDPETIAQWKRDQAVKDAQVRQHALAVAQAAATNANIPPPANQPPGAPTMPPNGAGRVVPTNGR